MFVPASGVFLFPPCPLPGILFLNRSRNLPISIFRSWGLTNILRWCSGCPSSDTLLTQSPCPSGVTSTVMFASSPTRRTMSSRVNAKACASASRNACLMMHGTLGATKSAPGHSSTGHMRSDRAHGDATDDPHLEGRRKDSAETPRRRRDGPRGRRRPPRTRRETRRRLHRTWSRHCHRCWRMRRLLLPRRRWLLPPSPPPCPSRSLPLFLPVPGVPLCKGVKGYAPFTDIVFGAL